MAPKLRLIDIAKKANVSIGTVDRVVNKRGKVAPKTEKKILDIIHEFDYQPNLFASSLSSKKKNNIAVLVPKPMGEDYWNKILIGVEKAEQSVKEFGVEITNFLYNQDDDIQFTELATQILAGKYNGVLLAPAFHKEAYEFVHELDKIHVPYVIIDTPLEESNPLCSISQNGFKSGTLAAKLLYYSIDEDDEILSIRQLTQTDYFDLMRERSNGFKSYFKKMKKGTNTIHFLEIVSPKYESLSLLLDDKFVQFPNIKGIFIANSKAYWIARYLNEKCISKIKLVGFDLIEQNIRYIQNGTIDFLLFDYAEHQGEIGLQILFDHLLKKKVVAGRINMPIHIVTKENLEGFLS